MNKLEQLKQEMNKPKITQLYKNGSKIYATYTEDHQKFDISLTTKELISELQTKGVDCINVITDWSDNDDPIEMEKGYRLVNRLWNIAKQSGYISTVKIRVQQQTQDNITKTWTEISGNLLRKA